MVARGVIEERCKTRNLTMLAPGSVFEIKDWQFVDTSFGRAINLSIIETKASPKGVKRQCSKIMVGVRFEPECEKIPCIGYYAGKKPTKNGNHCHDLRFIKHDDAELFHDSDEEETGEEPTLPPSLTFYTPGFCNVCGMDADSCMGFCGKCHEHLPTDAQHQCTMA